jgi:hypothetical protein
MRGGYKNRVSSEAPTATISPKQIPLAVVVVVFITVGTLAVESPLFNDNLNNISSFRQVLELLLFSLDLFASFRPEP